MHAGIAEVAAAKARMFVNKPDGSTSLSQLPFRLLYLVNAVILC